MSKVLELVMISVLLISAFFFGVAYSGPVKENLSWLFEVKEQEVEILEIRKKHDIAKAIKIKEKAAKKAISQQDINTTTSKDFDETNEKIGQNLN